MRRVEGCEETAALSAIPSPRWEHDAAGWMDISKRTMLFLFVPLFLESEAFLSAPDPGLL